MATINETAERIAARKAAEQIISLAVSKSTGKSGVFGTRLWTILQEETVKQVGLPKRTVIGVEPLNDAQAARFREAVMPFGKHVGLTIEEIEQRDPNYLGWIADDTAFTKELRCYLARRKFNSDED